MNQQAGFRRRRFNVEYFAGGQWWVADLNCLTESHAGGVMARLQKENPAVQYRVVPVVAFVSHRANYR